MNEKRWPIALDAKEVAYHPGWRAAPEIIPVTRHTPTQVVTEKGTFARANGHRRREARSYLASDAYIENITKETHAKLAARALWPAATLVANTIKRELEKRHHEELQAVRNLEANRGSEDPNEVKEAIARLVAYANRHNIQLPEAGRNAEFSAT